MKGKSVLSKAFYCFTTLTIVLGGCTSYKVPGRAASMELFVEKAKVASTEQPEPQKPGDIEITERKPTAEFPANIVVVRVQEPGYKSQTAEGIGGGNFSVVTVRDMEKDEDFERLAKLPNLAQISPMSRLLLPSHFQSDKELRTVAARLNADIVLIYTVDTTFLNTNTSTALSAITLGIGPTLKLRVISTVSGIIMDTRTGYIYGTIEETAKEETSTSYLSTQNACDQIRLKTERKAFEQFLTEFGTVWTNIVTQYKK
jgi:hypothetical protein